MAHADDVGFVGNLFIRRVDFTRVMETLPGHEHTYAHATFVGRGRVRVTWEDESGAAGQREYQAPDWFEMPAKAVHTLTALEPNTVTYCVFAARDPDGTIAETVRRHTLKNAGAS